MRCARCGNDNPGTNRFCGMCGATLLRPPVGGPLHSAPPTAPAPPAATVPAAAPSPMVSPAPAVVFPEAPPAPAETPVISGPSFLGLNTPAPEPRRSSLSIDPNSAPASRSLDYLLHDEDEPRGGGTKFLLIVLALALAVGLGYLRFKNQGLAWLKANATKPPAAQTSDAPESTAAQPPASSTNPPPSSPATPPAATTATPSTTDSRPAPSSAVPADSSPAATNPPAAPTTGSAPATGGDATPADAPAKPTKPSPPAKDLSDPNVVPAATEKPKPAPKTPKPAAPVKPFDPVNEAQNYIYGRGGVRQDCERGLRILKPQADLSNPKAMVEMGALYSAGLCTPRDLPTAYRWFALALRWDPLESTCRHASLSIL